jgi:glycosyltransferase involved in cell wall biosynthesis
LSRSPPDIPDESNPDMTRDPLAEKAVIGIITGGSWLPQFGASLANLAAWDAHFAGRLDPSGLRLLVQPGTNIPANRNHIVRAFLEQSTADWLWFVDDDESFAPDTLERLIMSADPVERPILSGLVYAKTANRSLPITPACSVIKWRMGANVAQPGSVL